MSLSVGIAITIISAGLVHTNVESFLFGSILTVSESDVWSVVVLSIISIGLILWLYPQLVLITFDEDGARVAGVKTKTINYIFHPRSRYRFRIDSRRRHSRHFITHCVACGYGVAAAERIPSDLTVFRSLQFYRCIGRPRLFLAD